MKTRQTLILLCLAVALILLAVWYNRREETMTAAVAPPSRSAIAKLTSGTLSRIEIHAPGETSASLTRRDTAWYTDPVRGHRADKVAVNQMFASLEHDVPAEVVSDRPENFSEYQVDETSGTRVKMFGEDGKVIQDLIIGKADPSNYFSTYVRNADSNEVLLARAALSNSFKRPEGWRDKQIFDFRNDAVVGLSGEGTSGTFSLVKQGDKWHVTKPVDRDAQQTKVNPISSTVAALRATDFIEKKSTETLSDFGLDPPRQTLSITYEDRSTSPAKQNKATLLIGDRYDKPPVYYYAKRADNDQIFTMTEYQATTFSPKPDDLAEPLPPPPTPAAAITSGTVTAGAMTTATAAITSGTVAAAPAPPETPAAPKPAATPAPAAVPVTTPGSEAAATSTKAGISITDAKSSAPLAVMTAAPSEKKTTGTK